MFYLSVIILMRCSWVVATGAEGFGFKHEQYVYGIGQVVNV